MENLNFSPPLTKGEIFIVDGGFSTQLSNYVPGVDDDPLWTARSVVTNPEAVQQTHLDFIKAGARVILTNSYQISNQGFQKYLDLDAKSTTDAIHSSVKMAKCAVKKSGKLESEILVGGSVGPFGACQHDGSEYTGAYMEHMSREELVSWHLPRVCALIEGGVDFIAAETMPSWREALSVLDCVSSAGGFTPIWLSFTLKDENLLPTGEPLQDAIKHVRRHELFSKGRVFAVGINCCHPSLVSGAIDNIRRITKTLPVIVYPNSGETWNGSSRKWEGVGEDWDLYIEVWLKKGVVAIGGCCRTRSDTINKIRLSVAKAILNT